MATAATRMLTGDGGTHVGDGVARRAGYHEERAGHREALERGAVVPG